MKEWWNVGLSLVDRLLGAAGGAVGGSTASAGGAGSAFKLSADGKGESGHHSSDFLALAFGASNLF